MWRGIPVLVPALAFLLLSPACRSTGTSSHLDLVSNDVRDVRSDDSVRFPDSGPNDSSADSSHADVVSDMDFVREVSASDVDLLNELPDVYQVDLGEAGDSGPVTSPVLSIAWFEELLESEDEGGLTEFLDAWDGPFCEADHCLFVTWMPGCPDVQLRGEFNDWKDGTFMEAVSWHPGLFYYFLEDYPVTDHAEYKLYCNGAWSLDPSNRYFRFADIAINSALYAAGHSRLALVQDVYSPQLDNSRNLYVYVPAAAWLDAAARFPVVYMQDGFNVFANPMAPFGSWDVDVLLDGLTAAGEVEPLLVVGIDTADRLNEYLYSPILLDEGDEIIEVDPLLDAYGEFLVEQVVPQVEAAFPAEAKRESRAIAGSSLGGLSALYIAWQHAEVFGRVASLSGSFWVGEEGSGTEGFPSMRDVLGTAVPSLLQSKLRIYLDSGDGGYDVAEEFAYAGDSRAYTDWVRNRLILLGLPNRPEWDDDGDLASPPSDFPLSADPGSVPTLYWSAAPPAGYSGWDDYLQPKTALLHLVGAGHEHDEAAWKARFPAVARFLFPAAK